MVGDAILFLSFSLLSGGEHRSGMATESTVLGAPRHVVRIIYVLTKTQKTLGPGAPTEPGQRAGRMGRSLLPRPPLFALAINRSVDSQNILSVLNNQLYG